MVLLSLACVALAVAFGVSKLLCIQSTFPFTAGPQSARYYQVCSSNSPYPSLQIRGNSSQRSEAPLRLDGQCLDSCAEGSRRKVVEERKDQRGKMEKLRDGPRAGGQRP